MPVHLLFPQKQSPDGGAGELWRPKAAVEDDDDDDDLRVEITGDTIMRTLCDVCESAVAILFCAADEAALCSSCDEKVIIFYYIY